MKKILLGLSILMLSACNSAQTETTQKESIQNLSKETTTSNPVIKSSYHSGIDNAIENITQNFHTIDEERQNQLKKLALYLQTKQKTQEEVSLIFICTHNSRRSHLAQFWTMLAADYYGINNIHTFSGGTEATAFNPRSVACLQRSGFEITPETNEENPVYQVTFKNGQTPTLGFSKKYTHEVNPKENFVAVMTCSNADKNCPTVDGAAFRVAIPYTDPKIADNTPEESTTYDKRSFQIATEMFYVLAQIKL